MKKKLLAIIALTVASIVVVASFVYAQINTLQNQMTDLKVQNSDLQEQINELQDLKKEIENQLDTLQKLIDYGPKVQISNFSSRLGWFNPVGVTMMVVFDIAISNNGISDVEGLTFEIKRYNYDEDPYNITKKLNILKAGETTTFQTEIFAGLENYAAEFGKRSFVASLKLGEIVLYVRHYLPEQW